MGDFIFVLFTLKTFLQRSCLGYMFITARNSDNPASDHSEILMNLHLIHSLV